jgi:anti-sigma B factor antagonist
MVAPEMPSIEQFERGLVITLTGELDAFDAPALRETFEAGLAGTPATIVLDLSSVAFLDSTILGAIVGLLRRQREAEGELRVVLPETTARRVFEITALDTALDIWPSRGEALAG